MDKLGSTSRVCGAVHPTAQRAGRQRFQWNMIGGLLMLFLFAVPVFGQSDPPQAPPSEPSQDQQTSSTDSASPQSNASSSPQNPSAPPNNESEGKQTKRILMVAPNFAAVNANTQLPPLSAREKFKLAREDSFDYTAFLWTGILSAQSYGLNQYPELGKGAAGYGRYYWRGFVDGMSSTYLTEAIVPVMTHEDPRYYTMGRGHGGIFRRVGYALSRVVLTKTDSGGTSFNYSEIGGNAIQASLSNLYYPPQERGLVKTTELWGTQIESAALNNLFKEFWPDIRRYVFRQKK